MWHADFSSFFFVFLMGVWAAVLDEGDSNDLFLGIFPHAWVLGAAAGGLVVLVVILVLVLVRVRRRRRGMALRHRITPLIGKLEDSSPQPDGGGLTRTGSNRSSGSRSNVPSVQSLQQLINEIENNVGMEPDELPMQPLVRSASGYLDGEQEPKPVAALVDLGNDYNNFTAQPDAPVLQVPLQQLGTTDSPFLLFFLKLN